MSAKGNLHTFQNVVPKTLGFHSKSCFYYCVVTAFNKYWYQQIIHSSQNSSFFPYFNVIFLKDVTFLATL